MVKPHAVDTEHAYLLTTDNRDSQLQRKLRQKTPYDQTTLQRDIGIIYRHDDFVLGSFFIDDKKMIFNPNFSFAHIYPGAEYGRYAEEITHYLDIQRFSTARTEEFSKWAHELANNTGDVSIARHDLRQQEQQLQKTLDTILLATLDC